MAGSYDFEEQERLAELKAWWEDNRLYLLGAVVAAALAFAGWQGWKHWKALQQEEAAVLYQPVADAVKREDRDAIIKSAKALVDAHPGSFHASDASLFAAKAAFDAGNFAEARKHLEWVADKGADVHKDIARLRLAAVLLEEKKYDEALKALDAIKDAAFVAPAADMRGDVMLAQGRIDEARAAYKLAIDKADARNPVKGIAETKLNALGGAK